MKTIFEKWWNKGNKCISLISYKKDWNKPIFHVGTNGAKRKNNDTCFSFTIQFFYLNFNYTNFDLQKNKNNETKELKSEIISLRTENLDLKNQLFDKTNEITILKSKLKEKSSKEQTFYSRIFVGDYVMTKDPRFANKEYKNFLIKQAKHDMIDKISETDYFKIDETDNFITLQLTVKKAEYKYE